MRNDWFRNTSWSPEIAQAFDAKLHRAREKRQYLRIQATILARTHPEVALELLDRYFVLPINSDRSQALVVRATALLALGRVDESLDALSAALAREIEFPTALTQAYLEFPSLIATRALRPRYPEALQVLEAHAARPLFPLEHFRWHAARALIAADTHDPATARTHAVKALEAATRPTSGFSRHPDLGLVTPDYDTLIRRLKKLGAL